MRAMLVLAALITAAPVAASAQDATERRRAQAYENLNQLEQNQRLGEVDRRISNMEIRRQSDEALRALQPPGAPMNDNPYVVPLLTRTAPTLSTEDRARDAELAATNARLKAIAQTQRGN